MGKLTEVCTLFRPENSSKKLIPWKSFLVAYDMEPSSDATCNVIAALTKNLFFAISAFAVIVYYLPSSHYDRHLTAFVDEGIASSSNITTTALLGIFSHAAAGGKRQYIRDTFIEKADERFCTLDEFIRQVTQEVPGKKMCRFPYTFIMGGGSNDRPTEHNDDAPLTVDMEMVENDETSDCRHFNKEGDISSDCTHLNIKEVRKRNMNTIVHVITHLIFVSGLDMFFG